MFQELFRIQADEKQESLETIMDKGYDQIKIIIQHNQWRFTTSILNGKGAHTNKLGVPYSNVHFMPCVERNINVEGERRRKWR